MIICKNLFTGKIIKFKNVNSVLRQINRDRSQDWNKYTRHDWKKGLIDVTIFDLVSVKRGV
ncbi:MAG: hypothetical protein WC979_09760 [Candidatus Pacearchaeota archaeon]|jgi:hypothetical protein